MELPEIHEIELDLLLEGIYKRWGYDFRAYARASLRRRAELTREELGAAHLGELCHRVLHDRKAFEQLAFNLSVSVTEFFRDPLFFKAVREIVAPRLASYPFLKVWHAGCSTGEEVYSMAILFDEVGLLERTTFFGTDFNSAALDVCREAMYPISSIEKAQTNYATSGGLSDVQSVVATAYQSARFIDRLRRRTVFSLHNLASDNVFSEVQMVICRNVLIYFNNDLQDRVLSIFADALVPFGILALGSKESLGSSSVSKRFKPLDAKQRIFQKVA